MKRVFPLIFTAMLTFSFSLPVHAHFSFQEDKVINDSTQASSRTSTAESTDSSQTDSSESVSETMSEDSSSEASSSTDAVTPKISVPTSSDSPLHESSENDPIGDTSSYYNIDNLGEGPEIVAESAILMDASTGAILYGKEADTKRYPASITKVMTALLAMENCSMDDIITFSNEAVNGIESGSSTAGINAGAQLTVRDTLYALMLVSANEAGAAIAEHISGSNEEFAKLMTQRAKELGCVGTNFKNPHGLPDEEHYTTAHDMALILKEALKYEDFRTISSADSYTLEQSDTLTHTLELWNHAKILRENSDYYYEYAEGAKTGYTKAALNTLVTYAAKDDVELLCVILKDYGADNSYYDTSKLFQWGFEQVKSIKPLTSFNFNEALSNSSSIDSEKLNNLKRLDCTFPEDYYILVNKDFDETTLKCAFTYDEDPDTGHIGFINIFSGDTVIGTAPVTYDMTTESGQSYRNGGESDDDLETAPVDENKMSPRKLLLVLLRIVIVLIVIVVIINMIRRWRAEQRRQKRIKARKKRHASSNTRNTTSRASSPSSKKRKRR